MATIPPKPILGQPRSVTTADGEIPWVHAVVDALQAHDDDLAVLAATVATDDGLTIVVDSGIRSVDMAAGITQVMAASAPGAVAPNATTTVMGWDSVTEEPIAVAPVVATIVNDVNTTLASATTQPTSVSYTALSTRTVSLTNSFARARVFTGALGVGVYAKTSTATAISSFGLDWLVEYNTDGSTWIKLPPSDNDTRCFTFASNATNTSISVLGISGQLALSVPASSTVTFTVRVSYALDGSAASPSSGVTYAHNRTALTGVLL